MADAMNTLKELLGDNAEDTIKGVMDSLNGGSSGADSSNYGSDLKALMDKLSSNRSDPRTNLLLSLKPYMSEERKRSIDGAVRLLSLSKLSGLMKNL